MVAEDADRGVARRAQIAALARLQLRLIAGDWQPIVVLFLMPFLLIAFIRPAYRAALAGEGYRRVSGAEQAVPGLAVLFTFMLVSYLGFEYFREHTAHTWDRLRASGVRPLDLMIGKALPFVGLGGMQCVVMFGAGALLFDLHVRGSLLALAVVCAALVLCVVALGLMLVAWCRTYQQLNACATLGAVVLAGIGGAISPLSTLPAWVRAVAHASPTYWAMRAFHEIVLGGAALAGVIAPVLVLLAFAVGFAGAAGLRLRVEDEKGF